jgi:hypothetical protein
MADFNEVFAHADPTNVNDSSHHPQIVQRRRGASPSAVTDEVFADPAYSRITNIVQDMVVESERLDAAAPALFEAGQEANREHGRALAEMQRIYGHYERQGEQVPDSLRRQHENAVRMVKERADGHQAESDKAIRRRNIVGARVSAAFALIKASDGVLPDHFVDPAPGDPAVAIRSIREREKALLQKLRDIKNAPLPLADAKKAVAAKVADWKTRLMPFPDVTRRGVDISFPQVTLKSEDGEFLQVDDLRGVALLAAEPAILAHLNAELERRYARVTTVARPADKARLMAEVEAEILQGQRVEAATIEASRERGIEIEPRALDPRALLAVDGPAVPYGRERTIDDEND